MSKNKFPKSVSFNLKNAQDQAILKHVKKRNFSGYVKKLILEDMGKQNIPLADPSPVEQPVLSKMEQLQQKLESAKNNVNSSTQHNTNS
ncbi:hypothetical protein AB1K09_20070 [Solibacillus silvestris]